MKKIFLLALLCCSFSIFAQVPINSNIDGFSYIRMPSLSTVPPTPSNGFSIFANNINLFSWKGVNGFVRTFDGAANTANRSYTLQNASGTIPLLESSQVFSGATNSFTNNLLVGTNTNAGFKLDINGTVRSQGILTAVGSSSDYPAIFSNGYGITNNFSRNPQTNKGIALDLTGGFNNTDQVTPVNGTFSDMNTAFIQRTTLNATNTGVTYTQASTLRIAGSPIAGTNVTITEPYSIYVSTGNSYFGGNVGIATTLPTSRLHAVGSQAGSYISTSTALTLAEHRFIVVTSGVVITLPSASSCLGRFYTINARSTGVTISSYFDLSGVAQTTLTTGTSVTIISDGTNWHRIS